MRNPTMQANKTHARTLLLLALLPLAATANTDRGTQIAESVDQHDRGWGSEVVEGTLTINAADGSTATRRFKMATLEKVDGGDKRAVVFSAPADLAGFVSLNHSQLTGDDRQWIYLPELNRSRRLSSRDKTGAFAGSEFSYEDVLRWELPKYSYGYKGQAPCGAKAPCEVIVDTPRFANSGYSRIEEYIDMDILQPRKLVYFDHAGRPFKELELSDYRQYGGYWRPQRSRMTNKVTGAVSTIEWQPYHLQAGLTEAQFSPERITEWK
jgi:Outer membrane lipoprotein-sorting protein